MNEEKIIEKKYSIHGVEFIAFDIETSKTLSSIGEEFDDDLMEVEKLIFSDNPIIIDVGANVGIVSFYFAKKYPKSIIYAYEAHPINYQNLIKGINENKIDNIYPFNLAVFSESNIEIDVYLHPNNTSASSVYRHISTDLLSKVKTISLKDIINQNNIKNIDFLKIDCEGSEFDILSKTDVFFDDTIHIENLFIEFHKFMENLDNQNIEKEINKLKNFKNCKNIKVIIDQEVKELKNKK
jgi:FkbM family methyltransferase